MDSTLHYIHNDSDLSNNGSFSPDEERRTKVQVSDQKMCSFGGAFLIPLLEPVSDLICPFFMMSVLKIMTSASYFL